MGTILVVCLIVLGIGLIWCGLHVLNLKFRKKEFSDWEVDDLIILNDCTCKRQLEKNGREYAKVKGWSFSYIYLDLGDDSIYKLDWGVFKSNKSASWRRNVKECEIYMGKKPGFSGDVDDVHVDNSSISNKDKIDGKSIILLTEVECGAYLKQALDSEDYDLAEKIRKQMEKYS
jgi:hypothetical protein